MAKAGDTNGDLLLPESFRQACIQVAREEKNADDLARRIAACRRRADPEVAERHAEAYALPLAVARRLYQGRHTSGTEELMLSVRGLPVERLAAGCAAATADAWRRRDWRLVGRLCYRLDMGRACVEHPAFEVPGPPRDPGHEESETAGVRSSGQNKPDAANKTLAEVAGQLGSVLRKMSGSSSRAAWDEVALGYLGSLPAGFLPPATLVVAAAGPGDGGWKLLRHVADVIGCTKLLTTRVLRELQESPCLFVRTLIADVEPTEWPEEATRSEGAVVEVEAREAGESLSRFAHPDDAPVHYSRRAEAPAGEPEDSPPVRARPPGGNRDRAAGIESMRLGRLAGVVALIVIALALVRGCT